MKKLGSAFDKIVKIGVMDASDEKNKSMAQKFSVTGFPTLKVFINGEAKDYTGARTADAMKKQVIDSITS